MQLQTDDDKARFLISDQGIGIPSQDLELIFDRYYRGHNARHSQDDGTGLGLPMARAILEAHGGHISVASNEGAGTVFTVSLPLLSEHPTAPIELSTDTPA